MSAPSESSPVSPCKPSQSSADPPGTLPDDTIEAAAPPPPKASADLPTLARRQQLLGLLGVAAVSVLVAFDSTIVSTTLPRVATELNGMALFAWVGTGYLLATAVTIPVFGRLGDLFGRKSLMLISVALVALCSIACGLAQTMGQLVAARTLQGIGGGMMIATAFAAPADLFPETRERVRWLALLSAAFAVASGIGPVLGGVTTESLGWRAAFFVVPLAALPTFWLVYRYFPDMRPDTGRHRPRIDWLGGLLLVCAVGAPLVALEVGFAGEGHPVAAALLALLGAVAIAILVPYERKVEMPMLPMRILDSREARLLNVAGLLVGAVMYILIYYGPLMLQNALGVAPGTAGLLMMPLVVGIPLGSIVNGQLFPRQTQPQRLMVLGALLLGGGCAGLIGVRGDVAPEWAALAFVFAGLGLGFLLPNLTLFMQMMSERRDVGAASALIQTTRAVGSAMGIAAVGVVVARMSVLGGVRVALVCCIAACVGVALLSLRIRMRNMAETAGSKK